MGDDEETALSGRIPKDEIDYISTRVYIETRDRIAEHYIKWIARIAAVLVLMLPILGNYLAFTFIKSTVDEAINTEIGEFMDITRRTETQLQETRRTAEILSKELETGLEKSKTSTEAALRDLKMKTREIEAILEVELEQSKASTEAVVQSITAVFQDVKSKTQQIESIIRDADKKMSEFDDRFAALRGELSSLNERVQTLETIRN